MAKKEDFKDFVKANPQLIKYVNNEEMTWQRFYEMYDLYGKDNDIWTDYLTKTENTENKISSMSDVLSWLKLIDLDSLQEGVSSLQRVLGVFQDFQTNKDKPSSKEEYHPRPLYRHFED